MWSCGMADTPFPQRLSDADGGKGTISMQEWEAGIAAVKIPDKPPNVLRFSCRQGARRRLISKNARSRAPKAVSCKRLLAGSRASAYGAAVGIPPGHYSLLRERSESKNLAATSRPPCAQSI